jgi:hypothetical protein
MKLISLLIVARGVGKNPKPNIYPVSLQIPELFIF